MGRQINFYMDEDTELAFIEEVLQNGQIVCVAGYADNKPTFVKALSEVELCRDADTLYLYQPVFGDLAARPLPDDRVYIDAINSPVVEFSRPNVEHEKKRIHSGRLWVEMKHWDDDENLVEKPEELGKWYSSLVRWIKKHSEKVNGMQRGDYCTPSLLDLVKQGYTLW